VAHRYLEHEPVKHWVTIQVAIRLGSGVGAAPIDGFFALPKGPRLGIQVDEETFEGNRIA
jgi:hypothetical protein